MVRLIALGTGLFAGVACAAMKTPETSSLFEKFTDPGSGCVSYVLRPGCVGYHQQSWYFTQKSMTDDGRYLFFYAEPDERVTGQKRMRDTGLLRTLWVIDFAVDRIRPVRIYGMRVSSLDVRNNRLWFIREGWVAYHDLGGSPTNITPVCRIPETLSVPGKDITELRVCQAGIHQHADHQADEPDLPGIPAGHAGGMGNHMQALRGSQRGRVRRHLL